MIAEASALVAADPQTILEFVLDFRQYAEVDPKFVRVVSVDGPDDIGRGSVRFWGRMRGLPPAPDRQDFVLDRWTGITFTGAARQPARFIFGFVGRFECTPTAGGTNVVHRYEFRFRWPFRMIERINASWLQRQIEREVADIAARFAP